MQITHTTTPDPAQNTKLRNEPDTPQSRPWRPRFRSSWCHDEQAAAEADPSRRVYLDELDEETQAKKPAPEPPTFTPTERQQWTRFVTKMLDTLLPYREAYDKVRLNNSHALNQLAAISDEQGRIVHS